MSAILTPTPPIADPAQAALTALARAGLRAAEDARRANTYMVVAEDGEVQHISPHDYLLMRQEQATLPEAQNGTTSH